MSPPWATQQLTGDATVHGAKLQTGRILQALTVRLECAAAGLLPPGNLHLRVHHVWQVATDMRRLVSRHTTCGHAGDEYLRLTFRHAYSYMLN